MEIVISQDELIALVSRALGGTSVTAISFDPNTEKVTISTSLNLLGLNQDQPSRTIPTVSPSIPTVTYDEYPEATPEEMAKILSESQKLTNTSGKVFEYTADGDLITRERNADETNLPDGEDIIWVRNNHD